MALAYALDYIERHKHSHLTNYAEFLSKFPPLYEAQIHENSSWSCVHGVERWRDNCGCNSGKPDWHQLWRKPLRESLDWLRDELIEIYTRETSVFLKDPWKAREDYINVILDRSDETFLNF